MNNKKGFIDNLGRTLGELEVRHPKKFLWLVLVVTILMLPGLFQLKIEPSLEKVLPQDLDVLEQMNFMRDEFGADMIYVFHGIEGTIYDDLRRPEILKQILFLEKKYIKENNVLMINSYAQMIADYNEGYIPNDYERIIEIHNYASSIGDIRSTLINDDFSIVLSEVKTNTGSNAKTIKNILNDFNYINKNSNTLGLDIGLTGYNALDKATFDVILSDFSYTTFIAFAFVGFVVYFTFRSIVKGMIPMVAVMVSLLWTNEVVGYLGIPMTVASMGAAAMVMGLGIDFGIHLMSIFREFRDEGKEIKESIILTLEKDIKAIVGTSITTIAGFLSLWFSSLPAMADLGTILLIGIFFSMIAALLMIMPLLYFYEKNRVNN
jgi:hypothetical protein